MLLLVGNANALTIKSAAVTRDPKKGDQFTVKGEFGDLAIDGSSAVSIEFDGVVAGFRMDELTRRKQNLSFKGVTGAPGLAQLVIDLKKRRFSAKGVGLELPGIPNPIVVRLGADQASDCALLPLAATGKPPKPGAKPKAIHFKVPRGQHAASCLVRVPVSASPHAVVVDVPTSVRIEATLAAGVALDAGSLQLFVADGSGFPQGPALCTLSDDGSQSSGDLLASNGVFTCLTTITEAATGTLALVVQGTAAGATLRSPTLLLDVVGPPSDADLATVLDVEAQASTIWEAQSALLGDTVNARLATIRALRVLPGVAGADISEDGFDIIVRFTSGEIGGLMLNSRFGDAVQPAAVSTRQADQGVARSGLANLGAAPAVSAGVTRRVASTALAACPANEDRTLVGTLKGIILKSQYFPADDDWPLAKQAMDDSCLPLDFKVADLTVPNLLTITQYATVMLSTHGIIGLYDRIGIVTDETATAENYAQYRAIFGQDELYLTEIPKDYDGGGRSVYVVSAGFLRRIAGNLDHAFVYASHCWSSAEPSEADAFFALGAKAFLGYDSLTSTFFARLTAKTLLPALVQDFFTIGDAYDQATKIDPIPKNHPETKGFNRQPVQPVPLIPAAMLLSPKGDRQLAYVGAPTITPESVTIKGGGETDFSVAVDRADSCNLAYDWSTSATQGALSDDMGHQGTSFQSMAPSVTYTANANAIGTDSILAAVHAPDHGNGPGPVFGQACAVVDVGGCGDDVVQAGEDCDGTDDAACPGFCSASCTCPPRVMQITFVGRGKWETSINGVNFTASETWTTTYHYDLLPDDNGFPQSPGPGTTVEGTSSITGSPTSDCSGGLVDNMSHGQATAPTPLFWAIGNGQHQSLFLFDTFGGYDYRLCDGEMNTLVGNFTPVPQVPPGYPNYAPALGFAAVPYLSDDWIGVPAHTQTFSGLGMSEVAAPAPNWTATACWNGTVQLSTDGNAEPPSLADVPEPNCF